MAVRSIEEAKAEAVERLKFLKVHESVLREFRKGKLNKSEWMGALFWLNNKEQEMVREFEAENKMLIYHVIHQYTIIGEMYNFLFVSLDDEEWHIDKDDLADGQALVYVANETMSDCSEFGSIGIEPLNGGIIRTW